MIYKLSKYLLYIFLFNIVSYICLYIFYKYKHPFWFRSPVAQLYKPFNYNGILTQYRDPINEQVTQLEKDFSWYHFSTDEDIDSLCSLLNNNYLIGKEYNYKYTPPFIKFLLNIPYRHFKTLENVDRKLWQVFLKHHDEIIAADTTRPLKLKINEDICHSFYVDFLCIKKKYRGQSYAPKLILKMEPAIWSPNTYAFGTFNMFIFKKDIYPLPFHYLCKYNYYKLKLDTFESKPCDDCIIKLNEDFLENTFRFFNSYIKKYKIYQIYTIEEFKYIFLNDIIDCYIKIDGNQVMGMVSFYDSQLVCKKTMRKSCELFYALCDKNLFTFAINKMKDTNYELLLCTNLLDNKLFIDSFPFEYTNNSYYHLYNYHSPKIKPKECGLLIL